MAWEEAGKEGVREGLTAFLVASADVRNDVDEVLACDDRVIAISYAIRGTSTDGGDAFEISIGLVSVIEDGLLVRQDIYEPGDRQAMIARYAELGGGLAALGDRPLEQIVKEMYRRFARGDVDGWLGLCADDYVMVDHRKLGWSETDKQGYRGIIESMLAASLDVRIEVDEVLACDDRVIAGCYAWRGHTVDGGGAFEIAFAALSVVEDGLIRRAERFEHGDRQAILARYTELTGQRRDVLGDRPPERFLARFRRLFDAHGVDAILRQYADDHVRVDHRTLGWEDVPKDDARPLLESLFTSSHDMRLRFDEVLACDDRVVACTFTFHGTNADGGGPFEIPIGDVMVVEDGLIARSEQFDHDDRKAMIARYVELGGGQGPLGDRSPERVCREVTARTAAHRGTGHGPAPRNHLSGWAHRPSCGPGRGPGRVGGDLGAAATPAEPRSSGLRCWPSSSICIRATFGQPLSSRPFIGTRSMLRSRRTTPRRSGPARSRSGVPSSWRPERCGS
jgi:ketosteroid isomerase-like protein